MARRRKSAEADTVKADSNSPACLCRTCGDLAGELLKALDSLQPLLDTELSAKNRTSLVDGLVCLRYSLGHNVQTAEDLASWIAGLADHGGKE